MVNLWGIGGNSATQICTLCFERSSCGEGRSIYSICVEWLVGSLNFAPLALGLLMALTYSRKDIMMVIFFSIEFIFAV